jgi:hypothetical protein
VRCRIFNLLVATSLLLCIVFLILWFCGLHRTEEWYAYRNREYKVKSYSGQLAFFVEKTFATEYMEQEKERDDVHEWTWGHTQNDMASPQVTNVLGFGQVREFGVAQGGA